MFTFSVLIISIQLINPSLSKDYCAHLTSLLSTNRVDSQFKVSRIKRELLLPDTTSTSTSASFTTTTENVVPEESDNLISENFLEADVRSLRSNLVNHFSSPRNSFANETAKQIVRKFIIDKFVKLRLETWTHKFNATEMKFLNLPVIEGMNIIALLPGSSRATDQESLILIGAHYDTVLLSPGVNDNGSGVVALLEVARMLTAHQCHLKSTIIFAAFDLEEYGGLGSRHLVHEYLIPIHLSGKRSKFRGAFILDTLLNFDETPNSQDIPTDIERVIPFWGKDSPDNLKGDFVASFTRKSIDSRLSSTLAKHWKERKGLTPFNLVPVDIATLPSEMPNVKILSDHVNFLRSDHVMFWYHNSSMHKPTLKAVFLTDTGPFRGYMRKCYHETCDDLNLVTETNLKFLKLIVEVLTASIIDIGDGYCKVSSKGSTKSDVRQSSSLRAYPMRVNEITAKVIQLIKQLL
uniref:Peptidase M28 domain-containing protein n=1 Tax=Tetranychus urticae TaxID=32264 RepID=T1JSU4_TETUR